MLSQAKSRNGNPAQRPGQMNLTFVQWVTTHLQHIFAQRAWTAMVWSELKIAQQRTAVEQQQDGGLGGQAGDVDGL